MSKILVVGGGSIGKRHMKNLLFLDHEVSIVEPNGERAEKIKMDFKIKTYASIELAFASENFICAFICSPTIFHIEHALACAKHVCHLFIEKPLSHDLEKVNELVEIVERNKLISMVGTNLKFFPPFQKMKQLIQDGAIGKILSARCQFGQYLPDWHPWEDYSKSYSANKKLGGGILLDSHEFDYMTWFLGEPKKIACFAGQTSDLNIDVEDVAEVILEFNNGAIAEIHVDYLQRFYQRNFEFIGEIGNIKWDFEDNDVVLKVKGMAPEKFRLQEGYDSNEMYIQEAKYFLDCIKTNTPSIMCVTNAKKVLEIILAAKKSSAEAKVITF